MIDWTNMAASMTLNSYKHKFNEELKKRSTGNTNPVVLNKENAGDIIYIARVYFDCLRAIKESEVEKEIGEIYHPVNEFGFIGGWDYKNKDEIKKVTMEKLAENGFKCKDEEIITDIFHIRIRDKEIEIKRFL